MDWKDLQDEFSNLDLFTPSVGFAFGVLAFSSTLSQTTCVPELVFNSSKDSESFNPSRDYFKLPLFLGSMLAFVLKCCFGIAGAMSISDDSTNIFSHLLFCKPTPEALLVALTFYALACLIPQILHL